MKHKLNLSNALQNAELIAEPILTKERKQAAKFKTYLLDARYYKKVDHYRVIDKQLRKSVGKSWNETRNHLRDLIPQQYHYRIDQGMLYKNRNGDFVDNWGRPHKFLSPAKTTGRIYTEYYVENDMLKVYKPYTKFPREKQYKTIKKKNQPIDKNYTFKFDYDIKNYGSTYIYDVRDFIKCLERNKKTYRVTELVRSYHSKWNKETRRFESIMTEHPKITHIKTHYEV